MGMLDRLASINEKAGETIALIGSNKPLTNSLATGVFILDYALMGGMSESYSNSLVGYQSSGKSTISLKTIASLQAKYPEQGVVLVDFEGTFDPVWALVHGVDLERLGLIQPSCAEAGLDAMNELIVESDCRGVVVDSIASIVPSEDYSKGYEERVLGTRARLVGKMFNAIQVVQNTRRISGTGDSLTGIFINQWRLNPRAPMNSDPRILPGGEQQKYQFYTRVDLGNSKPIIGKDASGKKDIITHNEHSFAIKKFKGPMTTPEGSFNMVRQSGGPLPAGTIDDFKTAIQYGKKHNIVGGGAGSYTVFGVEDKFRTYDDIGTFMAGNTDEYNMFKARIIALHRENNGLTPLPSDSYLCGIYHPNGIDLPT